MHEQTFNSVQECTQIFGRAQFDCARNCAYNYLIVPKIAQRFDCNLADTHDYIDIVQCTRKITIK